ncbi:MAG TPA: ATP-binding cassette domain-containing protein [Acidobacteriaceae bacterium]|nr:ATP-binding cassette domain-containing protein [Acidobacteriaceae bacterium]
MFTGNGHGTYAVRAVNLCVSLGGRSVLDQFTLDIPSQTVVALVGRSGSGKSTLLDCIAGLRAADSGRVEIKGSSRRFGYLMQEDALLPWRTIRGNVLVGGEIMGLSPCVSRANAVLRALGLEGAEELFPTQASEGMRRRASLARTILHDPSLLLLDEPFAHIDLPQKLRIQSWMRKRMLDGAATAVIVTHDLEDAITLADSVVVLQGPPLCIRAIIPVRPAGSSVDAVGLRSTKAFGEMFQKIWAAFDAPK